MRKSAWIIPPLALFLAIVSLYVPSHLARFPLHDLTIPLTGLAIASAFFLSFLRCAKRELKELPEQDNKLDRQWSILLLFLAGFGFFFSFSLLRYLTWHSAILDLGVYDHKTWLISTQASWAQAWRASVSDHFQPILLLYALLYSLYPSPVVLLLCQSLAMASAIMPLYLLTTQRLRIRLAGILVAGLYLLYPAVEFNALFDFHPDHLAIPLLLWAFYLAERSHPIGAICFAALTSFLKEPFFLTTSFFGLYLAIRYKQHLLGLGSFALSLALFCSIIFVNPHLSNVEGLRYLRESAVDVVETPFRGPIAVLGRMIAPYKLSYLYFHFGSLAFIPLLAPLQLLPALPSFLVSLLSATRLHSDPTSHYSAGAIASIFVALLYGISWIERKVPSLPLAIPLMSGLLVLGLGFNVAKSPSPLSLYFWSPDPDRNWNRANYRFEKQEILRKAESLIPSDPDIVVVSQNNLNSARLAHRNTYTVFPARLDEADYIILDTSRPHYVLDHFDEQLYSSNLQGLRDDPEVQLIFSEDGILVFKRSTGRHSMLLQGQ